MVTQQKTPREGSGLVGASWETSPTSIASQGREAKEGKELWGVQETFTEYQKPP